MIDPYSVQRVMLQYFIAILINLLCCCCSVLGYQGSSISTLLPILFREILQPIYFRTDSDDTNSNKKSDNRIVLILV